MELLQDIECKHGFRPFKGCRKKRGFSQLLCFGQYGNAVAILDMNSMYPIDVNDCSGMTCRSWKAIGTWGTMMTQSNSLPKIK